MNQPYIQHYLSTTADILTRIDQDSIDRFIHILFEAWKNKKKVITVGNGGSASTASHFAGDLLKTVANDSSQKDIRSVQGFQALCLTDNITALTAWINDSGWDNAYSGLLNSLVEPGDVVLLVSVHGGSGWSGNLVQALTFAQDRQAKVIGLSGFDGGKMKELCDACVVIPEPSTPHVEGLHSVIQHLVVFRLKQLIDEATAS